MDDTIFLTKNPLVNQTPASTPTSKAETEISLMIDALKLVTSCDSGKFNVRLFPSTIATTVPL